MKLKRVGIERLLEEIDLYQWTHEFSGFKIRELFDNNIVKEFDTTILRVEFEDNILFFYSDEDNIISSLLKELIKSIQYSHFDGCLYIKINTKYCKIYINSINEK
jgi:transcriptional regulator CtsR